MSAGWYDPGRPTGGGNPPAFRTVSRSRMADWLAQRGRSTAGAHTPRMLKRFPWPVCSRCGLIYLKNERTLTAIGKACVVEE